MRSFLFVILIFFCIGCNNEPKETTTRGRLHLFIPESIAPPIIDGVNEFLRLYRDNGAQITFSMASTETAVKHFINDSGKIALIPRPLTQDEKEQTKKISDKLNELIVAYDGIAVVVNVKNKLQHLTTTDIQKILSGSISKWETLSSVNSIKGAIKVYCQDSSDVVEFLKQRLLLQNNISAKLMNTASDLHTLQFVSKDFSSIGFVSLSWIDSAKADVKVLSVGRSKEDTDTTFVPPNDAVGKFFFPDPAYIYLNYYPLKRAIYMYTYSKIDLAMGFGTFIATADGQKLFLRRGVLPGTQKIKLRSR